MGRGPVAQVINHECKVVVEAGLEWAQKDGIPGLSAGREWTAAGEQHMKEVVRKLVTATEWEDLQETYYNLQGLSAQTLEGPKKWPHAARMQLEGWFAKQIEETRRRVRKAEAAVKTEPGVREEAEKLETSVKPQGRNRGACKAKGQRAASSAESAGRLMQLGVPKTRRLPHLQRLQERFMQRRMNTSESARHASQTTSK
mmetsp:Transcript_9128/g.24595  ORF Transcript_9128/g.24595 Transcript_9128/m.24595 type:complete len:200 (-) Transcript_9128:447-1046(-)